MRVVFLDRDGIINDNAEKPYILRWEDFRFLPDVIDSVKLLNEKKIPVFIATNQSAVHRGMMTFEELSHIHRMMLDHLDSEGAHIDDIFVCPHRPDEDCACRKPGTGLFELARKKYDIDFARSWFVGDSESDLEAGRKMGCKTYLLKRGESLKPIVQKIISAI